MGAVSDILTAIETRLVAVLPAYSGKRLKYSYDLENNDSRTAANAYGIGSSSASSVTGTNRSITLDQSFFVVLTRQFGGRDNDADERTKLKEVYDDLENLYRDFFESKLGIPTTVYLVSELSLDEPENIGQNVISVRMNFTVKHRKAT